MRGRYWSCWSSSRGRTVQVDPIKPTLKTPGTERLKLKYEELVSNFCFKFNFAPLHRGRCPTWTSRSAGRTSRWSGARHTTRQGLTLVHVHFTFTLELNLSNSRKHS